MASPMTRLARRVSSFRIQPGRRPDTEMAIEKPEQITQELATATDDTTRKEVNKEEEAEWGTEEQYKSTDFPDLLKAVDLGKVKEVALTLRKKQLPSSSQSITCKIIGQDEGNNNVVFFIRFSDGVRWVARIPTFAREPSPGQAKKMDSEYISMQYISKKTTFPLRDVYYWTTNPKEIGVAFALLSYVEGRALHYVLSNDKTFGKEKRLAVLSSVAEHMQKLYLLQFPSTGMLLGTDPAVVPALRHVYGKREKSEVYTVDQHTSFHDMLQDAVKDLRGKHDSSWSKNYLYKAILKLATTVPTHMHDPPLTLSLDHIDTGNTYIDPDTGKVIGFLNSENIRVRPAHLGSAAYPEWLLRNLNAEEFVFMPGLTYSTSSEEGDMYRRHYVKCWQGFNVRPLGLKYDIHWTKESHVMNKVWTAIENRDCKYENYTYKCVNEACNAISLKGVSRAWVGYEDSPANARSSIRGLIRTSRKRPAV